MSLKGVKLLIFLLLFLLFPVGLTVISEIQGQLIQ